MNRTACRLQIALYGFFQTSFSTRPPASYRVAPISRYTMISDRSAHTYPWMCPRYEMAKPANRAACVHESQRNIVASSDWQISLGTELLRRTCELGATFGIFLSIREVEKRNFKMPQNQVHCRRLELEVKYCIEHLVRATTTLASESRAKRQCWISNELMTKTDGYTLTHGGHKNYASLTILLYTQYWFWRINSISDYHVSLIGYTNQRYIIPADIVCTLNSSNAVCWHAGMLSPYN
jgi:hypothetical protein